MSVPESVLIHLKELHDEDPVQSLFLLKAVETAIRMPKLVEKLEKLSLENLELKKEKASLKTKLKELKSTNAKMAISIDDQVKQQLDHSPISPENRLDAVEGIDTNIVGSKVISTIEQLISAGPNPRLYLLCQFIFDEWQTNYEAVNLKEALLTVGQKGPMVHFDQVVKGDLTKTIAKLISKIFVVTTDDRRIYVKPTTYGEKVFQYSKTHYSHQAIASRLNDLNDTGQLQGARRKIIDFLLENPHGVRNKKVDREPLARYCGIAHDNVRKYVIEFIQLGIVKRLPDSLSNNSYRIVLFNPDLVRSLLQ